MPMAWLRKLKDDCLAGVLIWIALDRWLGMWQSMQEVIMRAPILPASDGCQDRRAHDHFLSRRRIDLDRVGSLVGHVAVDAGSDHARADLGSHRMLAGLMTCEALARERSQVSLRSMDVVARGAGHRRAGAKALAAPQQSDLIPVHVGDRGIPVRRWEDVIIQLFTRLVSERGPDLFPQARMA